MGLLFFFQNGGSFDLYLFVSGSPHSRSEYHFGSYILLIHLAFFPPWDRGLSLSERGL